MSEGTAVRVGVIGLGFMGKTHLAAYQAATRDGFPCRLAAVCDPKAERLEGRIAVDGNVTGDAGEPDFDASTVLATTDVQEVLASPEVDAVSICTPTDTHVKLAIAALEAGKHVLVEKPVAITSTEVGDLANAARRSDRVCLPAMCMRFWPGWDWLKDRVVDGEYGAVRSAVFERLSATPTWSGNFYGDETRSGGALIDLHIHDADFVRYLFGEPTAVTAVGTLTHATVAYHFDRGGPAHVTAEGGWIRAEGFEFRMRYRVVFEHTAAEFDLLRDPVLRLVKDGAVEPVALAPDMMGYDGEVRHFVDVIAGRAKPVLSIGDAVATTRLLEAERASLERGGMAVEVGG